MYAAKGSAFPFNSNEIGSAPWIGEWIEAYASAESTSFPDSA